MKNFAKILTLIVLLNIALYANAVGTITALSGSASILRDSQSIEATLGATLHQKDVIKTSDATKVQMIFSDDTIISIGKNSNFSIDEFMFESSDAPSAKFGLLSGAMRTITGKIGKVAPDKFSVKTKTATIGIRGTNFSIFAAADGSAKVFCTFGAISVTAGGATSIVSQGFYIQVSPDGTRSEPIKFTPQELKEQQDESLSSANDDSSSDADSSQTDESSSETASSDETSTLQTDSPVDTSSNEDLGLVVKDITERASDSAQMKATESIDNKNATMVMTGFGNHSWGYDYINYPYHDEVTLNFTSNGSSLSQATIKDFDNVFYINTIASTPTFYNSKNDFLYPIESISYSGVGQDSITLNSTGNYFSATSDLNADDSMSWGDWGINYNYYDGEPAPQLHSSTKTGLWIAGEATPTSVIEVYGHTATYNGIYRANTFANGSVDNLVTGNATLTVNFGSDYVSLAITGAINQTMPGSITNNNFKGSDAGYSFKGMFYGADGKSAGGNFIFLDGSNSPTAKGVYQVHTNDF